MQKKLEQFKKDFEGSCFIYQEAPHLIKKQYKGFKVSLVGDKFKLETDSRTFIVHHAEVEIFMEKVNFNVGFIAESHENKENKEDKISTVYVPENCIDLSVGLMKMFDKISSGNATRLDYTAAKSMSDIAGKIIDVEKVKLGYLSLSKR